jgi:hypothetical protein
LPQVRLREKIKFLASDLEDPAQYVFNGLQAGFNANIATDWNQTISELLESTSEDWKASAQ